MPFWKQEYSIKFAKTHTRFLRMRTPYFEPSSLGLPPKYIAVKFYSSECFPDTKENMEIARSVIKKSSEKLPIVILDTGFKIDDHHDYIFNKSENVYNIASFLTSRNNLDLQTKVVSHAEAFIGTYGGFSYIAPLYGVSSLALYAKSNFSRNHLDLAGRIFSGPPFGLLMPVHTSNIETIHNFF